LLPQLVRTLRAQERGSTQSATKGLRQISRGGRVARIAVGCCRPEATFPRRSETKLVARCSQARHVTVRVTWQVRMLVVSANFQLGGLGGVCFRFSVCPMSLAG